MTNKRKDVAHRVKNTEIDITLHVSVIKDNND